MSPEPLRARRAYNLAAQRYDDWSWQRFWRMAEAPIAVRELLRGKPRRFLDIGSGTGSYIRHLRDLKVDGVGLDISEEMLKIARLKLGPHGALVQGDARFLPFAPRSFSSILMARVLSHISEVDMAFSEVSRVLKSSGTFVLTDVHPDHAYESTRLPFESTKLAVETYKHKIEDVIQIAWRAGKMRDVAIHLVKNSSIRPELRGVDTPLNDPADPPIGYVVAFQRV